jgi:ribosomal protein S18 acetylase RimI-like enzyme
LKSGQVFRQFKTENDQQVTLRSIRWEDLPDCVEYANRLVDEREEDPNFGILLDTRQTLESEAEWLASRLASMEKGDLLSVVAEVGGKLVANSEVARSRFRDELHHGKLGISVHHDYRNLGIGSEMMKTLVEESRKAGFKTIELEVFASNSRAIHVYEGAGFRQVGRIPKKIYRKGSFTDGIIMWIEL